MTKAERNKILDVAAKFLTERGYVVVGREERPCERDRRCVIDLIARKAGGTFSEMEKSGMVFFAVKAHKARPKRNRYWNVDRRERNILLRACTNWILKNRWHGNFRFDVIDIYGEIADGDIDHIENVPLFPPKWRFW